MDLREKKTERSIKNAFLELRAKKPIEKITVKELTEKAEISKGTFYLHYADIYALSEKIEGEIIREITDGIQCTPFESLPEFTRELALAFIGKSTIINTVFSGSRAFILPKRIEEDLLQKIQKTNPEELNNPSFRIALSYRVYGGFYAYFNNAKTFKTEDIIRTFERLSKNTV